MQLNTIINNSRVIIAISFFKYDFEKLTYLRFLAKYFGYSSKNINRKSKFDFKSPYIYNLLSGPVILFYSNDLKDLVFFEKIRRYIDIHIVFVSIDNNLFLTDNFSNDNIKEEETNICLSLNTNFTKFTQKLFNNNILNAYIESIVKESTNKKVS